MTLFPYTTLFRSRSLLGIAAHRPVRKAAAIRCPILLVVAEGGKDFDRVIDAEVEFLHRHAQEPAR